MPDFKKHIVVGVVSVGLLIAVLNYGFNKRIDNALGTMMIGIATIYALLPDVDAKGSFIHRAVTSALLVGTWVSYHYFKNMMLIYFFLWLLAFLVLVNHRTIIHSLAFGAVVSAPFFWVNPYVALAAFTAFTSHLVADGAVSWVGEKDWW